jgi:hypothetical protein
VHFLGFAINLHSISISFARRVESADKADRCLRGVKGYPLPGAAKWCKE